MSKRTRLAGVVASVAAVALVAPSAPASAVRAGDDPGTVEPSNTHLSAARTNGPYPAATSGKAARPPVLGIAQIGKGLPVARGRVRVHSVSGRRIMVRGSGMMRTQRSGFFAIPSTGLPKRFLVTIVGGRVKAKRHRARVPAGSLQAFGRRSHATTMSLAHVTLATSVQARIRKRTGKSRAAARRLTLHAMRLPSYVQIGLDDRVNPSYVQRSMVRRQAHRLGGVPQLTKQVVGLALTHGSIRLSRRKDHPAREPVNAQAVRAQGDSSCSNVLGAYIPTSLATCIASSALAVANAIAQNSQEQALFNDLNAISTDLQNVAAQVSDLQNDLNSDFLTLMATDAQDQYDDAAGTANPIVGDITQAFDQLNTIAAADPSDPNFNAFVYRQSVETLANSLNPDNEQSVLNQVTTLQLDTVASQTSGLGTMPAAWAAIRASQPIAGNGGLQAGTTLYTNEMSTALVTAGDYWFNVMWQLAILTANYETYGVADGAVPDENDYAVTESVLGNTTAQGTCAQASLDPPCPGSISYYLEQQVDTIPESVPSGMVIDPTTDLVWASAGPGVYQSGSTGALWPQVTQQCGTLTLLPDLLNTVNSASNVPDPQPEPSCAWPGLDTALSQVDHLTGPWQLPTLNFVDCNVYPPPSDCNGFPPPYSPGTSPQFGSFGSGSGLLGNITSGGVNTLSTVTSPSPFAPVPDAWFQPSPGSWMQSSDWGSASGVVEFLPGSEFAYPYQSPAPPSEAMGPAGVWLNAPIDADAYAYTPPPSPTG